MDAIKLAALDEDDLRILSAQVQDSVCSLAKLSFDRQKSLFTAQLHRLADGAKERHLAVLAVSRVQAVRLQGITQAERDKPLVLLAMLFSPTDAPAGVIDLIFADHVTVRLEVECVEMRLADTGAAWSAGAKPRHGV